MRDAVLQQTAGDVVRMELEIVSTGFTNQGAMATDAPSCATPGA